MRFRLTRRHALSLAAIAGVWLLGSTARSATPSLAPTWRRTTQSCAGDTPSAATPTAPRSALASTGNVFVSHGSSGLVSILDLATGQVATLRAIDGDAHEVAVSPDGRWGVSADFGDYKGNYEFDGRRLAVVDLAVKRVARIIDLGRHRGPHDIHFLPGSSTRAAVTTQTTRDVVEVDVVEGRVVGATPTGAVGSHTLSLAADGRTALTSNEGEGSISRLDLVARTLVAKFSVGRPPSEGIAVTPDGREVWVSFRDEHLVRVVDVQNGKVLATIPGVMRADRMTMTADGRKVVIPDLGCRDVKIADVATRRLLGSVPDLRDAGLVKVLPDHRTALVPLLSSGEVVLLDLATRRVIARHRVGRRIDAGAWGPVPAPRE